MLVLTYKLITANDITVYDQQYLVFNGLNTKHFRSLKFVHYIEVFAIKRYSLEKYSLFIKI